MRTTFVNSRTILIYHINVLRCLFRLYTFYVSLCLVWLSEDVARTGVGVVNHIVHFLSYVTFRNTNCFLVNCVAVNRFIWHFVIVVDLLDIVRILIRYFCNKITFTSFQLDRIAAFIGIWYWLRVWKMSTTCTQHCLDDYNVVSWHFLT